MSTGRAWEAQLEHWCREYHMADRLVWQRNHAEWRDGQFRARGACDFSGVLAGGRGFTFDAKDCAGARWPLDRLEEHQAKLMAGYSAMGGLAFVALRIGGSGWVLSWPELGPRWIAVWKAHQRRQRVERGAGSWSPADGWGARMARPGDWLSAC